MKEMILIASQLPGIHVLVVTNYSSFCECDKTTDVSTRVNNRKYQIMGNDSFASHAYYCVNLNVNKCKTDFGELQEARRYFKEIYLVESNTPLREEEN